MEQAKKPRTRPNLIFMVLAMTAIVGVGAWVVKDDALPLMTAAVGSLGTLGLALLKPDEGEEVKLLEGQIAQKERDILNLRSEHDRELAKFDAELRELQAKDDRDVTLPVSVLTSTASAPMEAFSEGYRKGFDDGRRTTTESEETGRPRVRRAAAPARTSE